jgi:hypothetical protein
MAGASSPGAACPASMSAGTDAAMSSPCSFRLGGERLRNRARGACSGRATGVSADDRLTLASVGVCGSADVVVAHDRGSSAAGARRTGAWALASGRKRAQGRDAVSSPVHDAGRISSLLLASCESSSVGAPESCVGVAASMSPRPLAPRAAVEPIGDSSSRSAPEASARCPPRATRSSRAAVADRSGEPRADRAQRHPRLSRAGCSCCGGRRCRGRSWP